MRIEVKTRFVTDDGEVCLCKGLSELLGYLEETGSVSKAAEKMGLSLSKAWKLLDGAEKASGLVLINRQQGGKGGGRTELTENARELLRLYNEKTELLKAYAVSIGGDLP